MKDIHNKINNNTVMQAENGVVFASNHATSKIKQIPTNDGTFDTNYHQNLVNDMAENNSFLDAGNLTFIKIQKVNNATSVQPVDQENATSKLESLLKE